ncbi:MAG: PKD domain-containing protein [Bacteroidetes bacterium]|nr:PKD domain-containing protein [Bacteroidota bacterium]
MNKIKNITLSLLLALTGGVGFAQNGLEGVFVEKYYVSNAADATGSIGTLPVGSVTYRVYADMLPGYKFQALYGVPGHTMNINTSTLFFNNEDRGNTTPNGIASTYLKTNSVAIDSWFSVGAAGTGQMGIPKTEDDGVANQIAGNTMLLNADAYSGIPLTTQDGIVAGSPIAVTFVGLTTELNVFDATSNVGSSFTTSNGSIAALGGSVGPVPATNKVLIGQFTTDGTFHFQLNIQIGTPTSGTQNYVATSPVGSEIAIPSLVYTSTPISPMATATVTYCQGATASALTASVSPSCTLNWYTVPTGGTASSIAPTPSTAAAGTTTYYVSQTNGAANESDRTAITVTVNPLPTPTISATGPITFCAGGSVNLFTGTFSNYLWSNSATTQSTSISASGSQTVTVTDIHGCQATSAPISVLVNPLPSVPTISAGGSTSFCTGGSVVLTSSFASGNVWSTAEVTNAITVTSTGSYSVTETDVNGCTSSSLPTSVNVSSAPLPTIATSGSTSICTGQSVVLTASTSDTYLWSPGGQTTQSISVTTAGTYNVTTTNAVTCSGVGTSANTTVAVSPVPTAAGSVVSTVGTVVTFSNTSTGATSYTWDFGDLSSSSATAPVHSYATNGSYIVTLIASNGTCSDTTSFTINITVGIAEIQNINGVTLFPNPLTEEATIELNLNESTEVNIFIYDITGKVVTNIYEGELPAGINKLKIDASNLEAGIYYTAIVSKDVKKTLKMVVIK